MKPIISMFFGIVIRIYADVAGDVDVVSERV